MLTVPSRIFKKKFTLSSIHDFKFSVLVLGPSQSAPGQYTNYPQGQGQQYGGYRPPQPGPPQGQQQRPYGYDQVSIPTTLDSHKDLSIHSS